MGEYSSHTGDSGLGEGIRLRTRIERLRGGVALERIEGLPEGERRGATIVLLHGAFSGAWIWAERVMPLLARAGRRVLAFSLRGHGASEGRAKLAEARLDDYRDDLAAILESLPQPAVIVAHDLGALVAQRLVGRVAMRGLCLVSPPPPEGMTLARGEAGLVAIRELMPEPPGSGGVAKPELFPGDLQRAFFPPGLPRERAARYLATMGPESRQAVADMREPGPIHSAFIYRVPTLVVEGAEDGPGGRGGGMRNAFYHGGQYRRLDGAGRFPMLEPSAEEFAETLLCWLRARNI